MSGWVLFKLAMKSSLTGTSLYWVNNGETISVCAAVSGKNPKQMVEKADTKSVSVVRKIVGDGILARHVFMHSNGNGPEAVSMVDIPWSQKAVQNLSRFGLPQIM